MQTTQSPLQQLARQPSEASQYKLDTAFGTHEGFSRSAPLVCQKDTCILKTGCVGQNLTGLLRKQQSENKFNPYIYIVYFFLVFNSNKTPQI